MILFVSNKNMIKFLSTLISITIVILFITLNSNKSLETNALSKGYIVIIIDDFGNYGEGTNIFLNMKIPLTFSIMPFLPSSKSDSSAAHKAGFEVMLHLPMEPVHGKKEWLGPRGITCDLSTKEIQTIVKDGLEELQWSIGINNHMGSKATQDKRVTKAILDIVKEKELFFLDSKTTTNSVIPEISNDLNSTYFTRDVFLDNNKNSSYINNQLLKLGDIALEKGYAIGIGHVGPQGGSITAQSIKTMYPVLREKGLQFIFISQLEEFIKN